MDLSAEDDTYEQLEMFTTVLSRLKAEYVENPDLEQGINGDLLGMIEAIDPFSSFVEKEIFSVLSDREESEASPGLILSKKYGYAYVVSVFPGSSADKLGLRTGDILESVENRVTTVMSLWEARNRLRGSQGTDVTIRVVRPRRSQPTKMVLKRELIEPGEVQATLIDDGIGLLSVPNFSYGVSEKVRSKIGLLLSMDVQGILVDLRGNSTGVITEAVRVADLFLEQDKLIAKVVTREATHEEFRSVEKNMIGNRFLGLLINGGTSGPAELFSAALMDNKDVVSVGLRTNGLGSIQEKFEIGEGSVVFLGTRLIMRPNGKPLKGKTDNSSGLLPRTRSPRQNFITNFYFENAVDEMGEDKLERFYQELDKAIGQEQLEAGLEEMRKGILKKAA